MPGIPIATPFNIDIEFEPAEFFKRFLAYFIDFMLLMAYMLTMLYLLFGEFKIGEGGIGFVMIVVVLPMLFYTFFTELLMNGQTPGKRMMKIKVISLEGGQATISQYLLRWFLRFYEWGFIVFFLFWSNGGLGIMFLFFGGITSVIIIAVSKKSQRLGDIVAGTVVVNTKSSVTVDDTIFMHVSQTAYTVQFPEVMKLSDRDLNTIKNVLKQSQKSNNYDLVNKVAYKVQQILKVSTDMYALQFLEKLIEDYNYLATKE